MNPKKTIYPNKKTINFNWPTVLFLLIMTAIPAIPGLFILITVLFGADTIGEISVTVNPMYFDKPMAILIHAGLGVLFFLSMPFQFSGALRLKRPQLHKKAGYVAVFSGCMMGVTGVWMHHFLNNGVYDVRYATMSLQGFCLCAAFVIAIKHILTRNTHQHRRWVSRAVAIALSLVTLAIIEVAFVLVLGELAQNNEALIQFFHEFGNLVGMAINILVVEYYIKNKTD